MISKKILLQNYDIKNISLEQNFIELVNELKKISIPLEIKFDNYVIKYLNYGSFSNVYLATHDDKKYIIKHIRNSILFCNNAIDDIIREIEILSKLNHKNIIKFYGYVIEYNNIFLIFENGGIDILELYNETQPLGFNVIDMLKQISQAIYYLQKNNIIHRDIKLENIVYLDGIYKLIDFDFAININKITNDQKNRICGTPEYMPPELIKNIKINNSHWNLKSDIWCLGVCICFLITDEIIITDNDIKKFHEKISHNKLFNKYICNKFSKEIDIFKKMLSISVDNRITIEELISDLEHL